MPYLVIENFKGGLDTRRSAVAGVPGTCQELSNAHITRGGEIQSRKSFVQKYTLPTGKTFGLQPCGSSLYVFGSDASVTVPAGVIYQRLQHPTSVAITDVIATTTFDGKVYAIAIYADGAIYHFYDGVRVATWDTIATALASNDDVADALVAKINTDQLYSASATGAVITIEAATAGVPFTITSLALNYGATDDQTLDLVEVQPNVIAQSEVLGRADFWVLNGVSGDTITGIYVDGVDVLGGTVSWTTSHSVTAGLIAAQINTYTSTPNYTAVADGTKVSILTVSGGSTNDLTVQFALTGTFTVGPLAPILTGGSAAVTAQKQEWTATVGGTFEASDIFSIVLDGKAFTVSGASVGVGETCMTFKQKIHSTTSSLLFYSALNNPALWGSGLGYGFNNLANADSGSESLTALGVFQGQLAAFSRRTIQLWSIDVDPSLNSYLQSISNTGTIAPRSVSAYGTSDLFYLDDTGIRSLRARSSSNAAYTDDIGTAIDTVVQDHLKTLQAWQIEDAASVIEPVDGRYWLAVGSKIFVFSYFPASKISAWSTYDLDFDVDELVALQDRVFLRSGDKVYLYGGDDNDTYPAAGEADVIAQLPYLTAGAPATMKHLTGFDAGLTGTWEVSILVDQNEPDPSLAAFIDVGTIGESTYKDLRVGLGGECSHFAPRLVCNTGGNCMISNIVIHYEGQTSE